MNLSLWSYYHGGFPLPPQEYMIFFGVIFIVAILGALYFDLKGQRRDGRCRKCQFQLWCTFEMDCSRFKEKDGVV